MTRKEFEETEIITHPVDGMNYNPNAQPDCKKCNGMGIVDSGDSWGCILELCNFCWIIESRTVAGSLD